MASAVIHSDRDGCCGTVVRNSGDSRAAHGVASNRNIVVSAWRWYAEIQPQPAPSPAIIEVSDGLISTVEGTVIAASPIRRELKQDAGDEERSSPTQRLDVSVSSVEVVTDEEDVQAITHGGARLTVRWPVGEPPASPLRHW